MRKKIIVWSLGIGFSLAALLGASAHSRLQIQTSAAAETNRNSSKAENVEPHTDFKSVRVHRVSASKSAATSYTGVIQARHESDLAFRVSGKIIKRDIEIGDRVRQGDTLALLDPVDYELAVKLAEADVVAAEADASNFAKEEVRYVQLAKSNSVSQSEVDRVQDGRRSADARLERAKRAHSLAVNRHEYCVLRAEANGVVTSVMGEVGEVVTEGRPVVRIAQTDEMEAVIHLPENRAKIEKGYVAHATVWAESNSDYQVSLRELSPIADAATRTYQAKFTIHNPGSDIALGRTITLRLATISEVSKFEVPLTAIRQQGSTPAVWLVDNDHIVSVPISIDSYREDSVLVSQGVASGDLIVAAGVQKLDPAVRVQVWGDKQ